MKTHWILRLVVFFLLAIPTVGKAQQRPNILIIISDDHAYQAIGAYGSPYRLTPHIDSLAKKGQLFTQAFVTNSICGPSRATLLTSKYSNINGFKDNFSRFNSAQQTFASILTQNGYQTAWIGKWHLENLPKNFSYFSILNGQGHYYNPEFIEKDSARHIAEGYCTNLISDYAIHWLSNLRKKDAPFCLVVGHKATHRTWIPDTADYGRFDNINFALPATFYDTYEGRAAAAQQKLSIAHSMRLGYDLKMDALSDFGKDNVLRMTPLQRKKYDAYYQPIYQQFLKDSLTGNALAEWKFQRYMKDYYATAHSLDKNIGRLTQYLAEQGLDKNTIVIYTSDQGFYLGEHGWFDKRFMYEESFKTPLVISYPGVIAENRKNEKMVSLLDVAPTLLDMAGVPIPIDMQGRSLKKMLTTRERPVRKSMFYHYYEYPNEHHVLPHFGVRNQRYKLMVFYKPQVYWELYDLKTDTLEIQNQYNNPAYKRVVKRMKKMLRQQIEQYQQTDALEILNNIEKPN